jgi:hypothetical protein
MLDADIYVVQRIRRATLWDGVPSFASGSGQFPWQTGKEKNMNTTMKVKQKNDMYLIFSLSFPAANIHYLYHKTQPSNKQDPNHSRPWKNILTNITKHRWFYSLFSGPFLIPQRNVSLDLRVNRSGCALWWKLMSICCTPFLPHRALASHAPCYASTFRARLRS